MRRCVSADGPNVAQPDANSTGYDRIILLLKLALKDFTPLPMFYLCEERVLIFQHTTNPIPSGGSLK